MPFELVDRPARGRVFEGRRRVRLAEVGPADRLRLDAVARYLQDIARDDSADSGLENPMGWVVRRTVMRVDQAPVFQEEVELATWCSGVGPRWAERRTSLRGEQDGRVEAATIWVHVDPVTGKPARLAPGFGGIYGEAANGRGADARLTHDARPPEPASRRSWPLRATDFDVLGHVNNAAYVEVVEEVLAERPELWIDARVEVEYRDPLLPGGAPQLVTRASSEGLDLWLVAGATTHFTARIERSR